jgi:hypothetical protein
MVSDPTALAIVEKKRIDSAAGKRAHVYMVRHLQRWLGVDYPTIGEQLRPMFAALSPPPTLIADETGVGVGVLQIFRRLKLPVASIKGITITGGSRANQRPDGGFSVPKKELVSQTQSALQGKRLLIAPQLQEARQLRKELSTFKVKINIASASESFEAWRESDKDDLVLACCMAVWFGEQGGWRLGADSFFV